MIWLRDDGERPSNSAALEKLPCSATATKARRSVLLEARIQLARLVYVAGTKEPFRHIADYFPEFLLLVS
jgi:hypothetical protein